MENFWKKHGLQILIVLTFLVNINTLFNDYALDDAIVITQNEFTKQGAKGIWDILSRDTFSGFFGKQKNLVEGGRYRPLSLVTFALEYEIFGKNPFVSHLINLLLYALSVYLLYVVLLKVFPENLNVLSVLFITALFALHPIHTEVVANIKGRDEILAFLLSITAAYVLLKQPVNSYLSVSIALFSFFLALMSKEIAVVFVIIIPAAQYLLLRQNFKKALWIFVILLIPLALFLTIRYSVLGKVSNVANELMNNPFLEASVSQKYATIAAILLIYVKLLIFPHPLTFDYYPYHIPLYSWEDVIPLIGVAIYAIIIASAIIALKKKNTVITFGIVIFLVPLGLVSNIFFPIGTFMNERFIYVSSLGYCMVLFYALEKISGIWRKKEILPFLLLTVLLLYGFKTVTRNSVWKNDYTLFTTDVKVSANSAKANTTAGGNYLEKSQVEKDTLQKRILLNKSIFHLRKALSIHPKYRDPKLLLGNAYWEKDRMLDSVIFYYKAILEKEPDYELVYTNAVFMADKLQNPLQKIQLLESVYRYNPRNFDLNYKLGNIYGKELGNVNKAIQYLKTAYTIDSNHRGVLCDLGVANGMTGNYTEAINILNKALEIYPNDADIHQNLGITYYQLGDVKKANEYLAKAKALKQENK